MCVSEVCDRVYVCVHVWRGCVLLCACVCSFDCAYTFACRRMCVCMRAFA